MKRIDIIIRPEKLENLKKILSQCKIGGITVTSVMGCGNQRGNTDIFDFKGLKIMNMNLIPKIMAIVIINDEELDNLLGLVYDSISTGKVGDGKVFVSNVEDVMRISTGERGKKSI